MRQFFIYGKRVTLFAFVALSILGCKETSKEVKETVSQKEIPEYFLLRPEVEKAYGYSHAVKTGNDIKFPEL